MPATLLICSLSFVGFCFECPIVGFDVSWFLAVVANSVVPGLAPASLIVRGREELLPRLFDQAVKPCTT